MKKGILTIVLLVTSLLMVLVGCSSESKANTPEEFMSDVLTSKNIKSYYANVLGGDEILDSMSSSQENTSKENLEEIREANKENVEFKVLENNSESKYIRVAGYKKGTMPKSEQKMDIYYIIKADGKYKLDTTINGFNTMNLITYESESNREATDFKVYAKLSKEYKYEFIDLKDQYYSIDLAEYGSVSILHGYIKKDSEQGKKLYGLLKDGSELQLNLSISIPEWIEVNRDVFLIDAIKSEGWAVE